MLRSLRCLMFLAFALTASPHLSAQQWGHYTLYGIQNGTTTYMVDTNGTTFKTWTHASNQKTCYSSYLEPGGVLVRSVTKSGGSFTNAGPSCGTVQKVDWNGAILWTFDYATANYWTHHDIHPMPNGNVLLISWERRTSTEVAAAGVTGYTGEMYMEKIVEIEPVGTTGGNVVWEWKAWDHICQSADPSKPNYVTSIVNNPQRLNINYNPKKDWMHMNGVSYNPMLDQITFSSHNHNEVYVIDHSTTTAEAAGSTGGNSGKGGDILYRWGNPAAYQATGTQIFKVVHDAHWNPENVPNPGYLCGYNNQGISFNQSCADQFAPPYDGYNYSLTPGSAYLPSTYALRQASGGYNSNMGNMQVLPNGNKLLCLATAGIIKEFDPAGNMIWSKTASGFTPKAFRYDSCYIFNTPPAIPTVTLANDTLFASTATTYQWYYNGYQIPGATNAYYVPTQTGNYKVRITDINGCVLRYSEDYFFDITSSLQPSGELYSLQIFPNPTTGIFNIRHSENGHFTVMITDETGRVLKIEQSISTLDLSAYEQGIYFITLIAQTGEKSTRRVVYLR